ncbi:hypothetical protein ABGB19_10135 [Mycobacterium sp. B14F4]|uniref:hypothetical protein n=1 Tax=Mycobacterium sp. B14F4 TaxID=3153565 RepID=UPI00325F0C66
MPDDLLRFVSGPMTYSAWWLWLGLLLLTVVIAWYVGVFVWTMPAHRLRGLPGIRSAHRTLLRRRFANSVRGIATRHRGGELTAAQAGAAMSRTLRSFLYQATGTRAQYMHVDDIGTSDMAPAAPLLSALEDAQFNSASSVRLDSVSEATEELIRSWP